MARRAKPCLKTSTGKRRSKALVRLGEKYAEGDFSLACQGQPEVTSCLRKAAGGLPLVLEALSAFEDEDAHAFVEM